MMNPFSNMYQEFVELRESINHLNHSIDRFFYWINPSNAVNEFWNWVEEIFQSGNLDIPFIVISIIFIWLIMLGAKWPKKWLYWGWIVFWILRGFVFNGIC